MDGGQPTTQRGAGNYHGRVSFFSVDVYVDYIEEMSVGCRVPSVAFRFLDFPTITVYSPASSAVRPEEETRRLDFSQGKSCVFEMVEADLQDQMRRSPLRVAWVDTWQLKERELGAAVIPMAGMNRRVRSRPAHVQQGRFRLHDARGQHICTIGLRLSVLSHGDMLDPDLLQHREYRAAPQTKPGMRDDWEVVIKRLVREYYNSKRELAVPTPARDATGRVAQPGTEAVRNCERRVHVAIDTICTVDLC
jgi:hypothetical protein